MRRWWYVGILATISITAWLVFMGSDSSKNMHLRTKRHTKGIKDAISKDTSSDYSSSKDSRKIKDLSERVISLETKMDAAYENEEKDQKLLETLQEGFDNATKRDELLEKEIKTLTGKLREVEVAVNADPNYWSYSTECGGVMISQMGRIAYTEPYRYGPTHSRTSCVWTIRANFRSKIHVQLTSLNPHVIITELIIAEDGTHTVRHTKIGNNKVYIFNGPVIFVTSITRSIALAFGGQGKAVHENTDFKHIYNNQTQGSYNFSPGGQQPNKTGTLKTFTTFVARIDPSNLVELDISLPSSTCANASFHLQTGDDDFDGPNGRIKNNSACCFGNPTSCKSRRYTLDGWFISTYSTLLPNANELTVAWKAKTNQSDSSDRCGGILMGKGGKISYKKLTSYSNNERCTWVIYPFPKRSIKIIQFSSGFETTYDHVTVLEVDKEEGYSTPLSPLSYSSNRNFTGRVVLITFYSDTSIYRQGFELVWEAVGPSDFTRNLESEKILHNSLRHTKMNNVAMTSKGFALQVITSGIFDGSSLDLSVTMKHFIHCPNSRLKVYGTNEGHLSLTQGSRTIINDNAINPCTANVPAWNISSPDGIGLVFIDNKDAEGKIQMDIAWNFVPAVTTDASVTDKCGGVMQRSAGRLQYKLDINYDNGERCTWLIHSPTSSEIKLKLIKEGFELCCDYVLVNTIDPATGRMNNLTTVLTRENNTRVFPGNMVIVTFRSDASVVGKGFIVEYTGQGSPSSSSPTYKYKLIHVDDAVGSYRYQRNLPSNDGWGDAESDSDTDNKIYVIAYSVATDAGEGTSVTIFNVTVSDTVFGVDANCQADIFNLYSTPSREGFTLGESYPKLECQPTVDGCGNCVGSKLAHNDSAIHSLSSGYRVFVGIYKPVKASGINNQSFHIHWDSSSGCGGVEYSTEGRITYKVGSRYKNFEQCIWTVDIPTADKIRFSLINNGFEACCDNIILSSLDPKTGSIGSSTVLKSGKTIALMTGPVVFVTFRTDGSVTGEGFTLTYSGIPRVAETTSYETTYSSLAYDDELFDSLDYYGNFSSNTSVTNPPTSTTVPSSTTAPPPTTFNYYHQHFHRRNSSFTLSNPKGGLGPNDILTVTYSPEPYRNESFSQTGTRVNFTALDLQVNNETCASDSLKFFEAWTREGFNASRSYAVAVPDASNCSSASSSSWGCENCPSNQTLVEQKRGIVTHYPAFIAIYKSVTPNNGSGNGKAFKIEWTDFLRVSEPVLIRG